MPEHRRRLTWRDRALKELEDLADYDAADLKPAVGESLQEVARAAALQSYEVPRDFIVETTPFTLENGLLTGIRKLARPKLKEHYGERLEALYGAPVHTIIDATGTAFIPG